MIDYLEEHLGSAKALLERVRQMEQGVSDLHGSAVIKGEMVKFADNIKKQQRIEGKDEVVSNKENIVYNSKTEVNHIIKLVDNMDEGLRFRKNEESSDVNYRVRKGDDPQDPDQAARTSEETRRSAQTSEKQVNKRPPVSVQMEELDRAVSTITAMALEQRRNEQSGWPVFPPNPQGLTVDFDTIGVPGENWSESGTAVRAGAAHSGMQCWVEQADRMFRRDSRRYDGGFYLY